MVDEIKVEHVLILAIVVFLLYHFIGRCRCNNGFRVGGDDDAVKARKEAADKFLADKKAENEQMYSDREPINIAGLLRGECGIEKAQLADTHRQFSQCHKQKMEFKGEVEKCNEQVMMLKNKMKIYRKKLKFTEKQGDADEDCDDKISKIVAEVDQAWEARFNRLLDPLLGEEL